jgi:hypothetical protein
MKSFDIRSYFGLLFFGLTALLQADEYYWTGGSTTNSYFSNEENWDVFPNALGPNNDFYFGKSEEYQPYVDQDFRVRTLTILRDSEQAYILDGNTLVIYNDPAATRKISNLSLYQLEIYNSIRFDKHPWYSANTTIDTGRAGIAWYGVGYYPHDMDFTKEGSGELYIAGSQQGSGSETGVISYKISSGRILFDLDAGATVRDGSNISFGNSSTFEIRGTTESITLGNIGVSGANGGGRLVFSSNDVMQVSVTTLSPRTLGVWSTLHIDLGGSTLNFVNAPNLDKGLISATGSTGPEFTVKQGGVTGFATLGGGEGKTLVRYNDYTESTTVGENVVWNSNNNFVTTGGNWTVNTTGFHTLTIRGAGQLSGTLTTGRAILMEEGVNGDYTIDVNIGGYLHVHQYSMEGNLVLNKLGGSGANNLLTKTGPGTVVITDSVNTNLGRGVYIQQGRLQVEGTILSPGGVFVHDDATLGGSGTLGGGSSWTSFSRNYVSVLGGGTLDGTSLDGAQALTISGAIDMARDAQFLVVLTADRGDPLTVIKDHPGSVPATVVLNGNLALTLEYAPQLFEIIVLLRTDGDISGTFLSYNDQRFGGITENLLTLSYNGQDYEFLLLYDYDLESGYTAVALQAIPEPTTISLLAGLALITGWICLRRRGEKCAGMREE